RVKDGKFSSYNHTNGLVGDNVRSVFESSDGTLWVGTLNGVSRMTDGKFSSLTVNEGLASNFIRDIREDKTGAVWIATDPGLHFWKDGKLNKFGAANEWNGIIRSVCVDHAGNVWMGTML